MTGPAAEEAKVLLDHYKQRAGKQQATTNAVEAERRNLLVRLEQCQVPQAELYRLATENRLRMEEVRELQKALSDAHTFLFEERERLLKLQAENDQHKLQEMEDRKRIKQLLSLTRPTEQTVRYSGARLPGQENGPQTTGVFPHGRSPGRQSGAGGAGSLGPPPCGPSGGAVLRTVYLPTAQTETLALKCEALQAQLAEQKRFAGERIQALVEDRALREREASDQTAALTAALESATERLRGSEEAVRRTTKDYIIARQQRDAAQAEAAAVRGQLAAERTAAAQAAKAAAAQAADDLARLQAAVERHSSEAVEKLQAQLRHKSEALITLETVHGLIKADLEGRVDELEQRCARLAEHNHRLQARRGNDMQGWISDVTLLRKQIAAVDRRLRQMRVLERLPDDERRDAILAKHAARAPSAAGGDDGYELSVEGMVEEMRGLKEALLGMGARVREQAEQAREDEEGAGQWGAANGKERDE
eukprot:scaffold13.g203.t1